MTPHNIKLLKKVNQVVFPIVYHDKFYKDVLESGEYAKLAYYNDVVVGAVCCRVDVTNPEEGQIAKKKLYIMTLGCLAPYRRLGKDIFLLNLLENSSKCRGRISNSAVGLTVPILKRAKLPKIILG